jgi:hypothetical protein
MALEPHGAELFGASGSTPEAERTLRGSVNGCLPYVWAIWGSVLTAALLGVV